MCEAVIGRKRPLPSVLKNPAHPSDPVVQLALNEMSQDAEGAERPLPLVCVRKIGWQILKQHAYSQPGVRERNLGLSSTNCRITHRDLFGYPVSPQKKEEAKPL